MGDLTRNFSTWEFACHCGCGVNKMSNEFLTRLQTMRSSYGATMTVTSGARCAEYNEKVGGKPDSEHIPDPETGEAEGADIAWKGGSRSFNGLNKTAHNNFMRIGIADNFFHLGSRASKAQGVTWRYPSKKKGTP